jgi:hypothetical protein
VFFLKNAVAIARVIFTCLFFGGKNAVALARVSFTDLKSKFPRV